MWWDMCAGLGRRSSVLSGATGRRFYFTADEVTHGLEVGL